MSITIQILSGERYGETLVLDKTHSFGRAADISFDDPKMSKLHAIFQLQDGKAWVLKDNQSKNGVMVNGVAITERELVVGDLIDIGITQLRVSGLSLFWKPQLNQLIIGALDKVKNLPLKMTTLSPIPVLTFVEGLQVGESWVLEYAPRSAGGESEDLQIFEPKCPDLAFEIISSPQGPLFKTAYPKIVKINSTSSEEKILAKGDKIFIYNTVIAVDFVSL